MQCHWQRMSERHKGWRTARAECMWYQVREEIQEKLRLVTTSKGRACQSCVVGFHFQLRNGKIEMEHEYIDQEWVRAQDRILVRIMPKCITVPPRMRSLPPLDAELNEDERLAAMQRRRFPVEIVGRDPRDEGHPHYVCKNCSCVGHYRGNCQWLKIEETNQE